MLKIGCHLSASKGFNHMAKEALKIGANTFQFFTRNPRGFGAKDIDEADIKKFHETAKENGFAPIVAHAPYTLNPSSADEKVRDLALRIFKEDMERMEYVPGNLYNFHPGSHVGQGAQVGIELTSTLLNIVLTENMHTTVLLETMSGKGSEIGRSFEELRQIIDRVRLSDKIGVCLDTCHVYDGGYDIVNNLDDVLESFDKTVGLERLKAIHLNDSKNPFESHKDRHEKIGEGSIGTEAFGKIINHPSLRNLPFILETPNELDGYEKEIQLLKQLYI
ncbi:MAG: deoxyribonuclease IV [Clostridia bacterium]|nr:deoxyribonuclease IV [Clostridia bacterium]